MSIVDRPVAYYYDTRVIIWDIESSRYIWSLGFYGKPIGVSKPKSAEFHSPLLLDLLEALYLLEKRYIMILDKDGGELSIDRFIKLSRRSYVNFDEKYMVYKDLREKGYIVLSGLKFGVDFAIYEKGPGIEHAPYLVDVIVFNDSVSGDELIRAGRLATTVRKRFIIAIPNLVDKKVRYLMFTWWKP